MATSQRHKFVTDETDCTAFFGGRPVDGNGMNWMAYVFRVASRAAELLGELDDAHQFLFPHAGSLALSIRGSVRGDGRKAERLLRRALKEVSRGRI